MKSTTARAIQHQRDQYIVYDSCLVQDAKAALFDPLFWGDKASLHCEGRGAVWFLSAPEGQWVLKRYVRGGMMKNLLTDAYLFTGFARTRMVLEFNLLCQMRSLGLPVPTPVAAYAVAALVAVALIGWLVRGFWLDSRARDVAAMLAQTPGIVVTELERNGSSLNVSGLRDR
ncbi:MAG: lipopolysaccharide kinase InaA family protein, partial [Pseudomonadales bacterium]